MEKPDLNNNQENISNESQSEGNFVEIKNDLLEASQKIDEDIEKRKNIESNKEKEIRNTLEETLDKETSSETPIQRAESAPVIKETVVEKQSDIKPIKAQKTNEITKVNGDKKDEKKESGVGGGKNSGFWKKFGKVLGKIFSPLAFVGSEITKIFAIKPAEKKK